MTFLAPALLVEVTGLAVEFNDHCVLLIAGVAINPASALRRAYLPFRLRQPVSALHVTHVPALEHRMRTIGDIPQREVDLAAPARPGSQPEALAQQERRGQPPLAGSRYKRDDVVEGECPLDKIEHGLVDHGAGREQPRVACLKDPG